MPDEIRLTPTSYAVLGLVDFLGPSTPYELKRSIEQSVENFWPVPHTTFYVEPARLAKAGYLSERQEAAGRRRKVYELTDRGRDSLAEWIALDTTAPPQIRDEGLLRVFLGADPVPIVAARMAWHRAKLEELEGYLSDVRAAGGPPGVERSLLAGTGYQRAMIGLLTEWGAEAAEEAEQ